MNLFFFFFNVKCRSSQISQRVLILDSSWVCLPCPGLAWDKDVKVNLRLSSLAVVLKAARAARELPLLPCCHCRSLKLMGWLVESSFLGLIFGWYCVLESSKPGSENYRPFGLLEVEILINMTYLGWAYEGVDYHAMVDRCYMKLWQLVGTQGRSSSLGLIHMVKALVSPNFNF